MIKKSGPVFKRSAEERQQDLNFIAPLLVDGLTKTTIAERLTAQRDYQVSRDMVFGDIKKLLDEWKKERVGLMDRHKSLMIERAEKMWSIACENWELSKKGKTKTISKQKRAGDPKDVRDPKGKILVSEQQKHFTESIGDPVWYNAMMDAWKVLYDILDLKHAGKLETPKELPPVAAVVDVYFITRTRKGNPEYEEAHEVDESGEGIQKLIQS